jgi:hypothetical protein
MSGSALSGLCLGTRGTRGTALGTLGLCHGLCLGTRGTALDTLGTDLGTLGLSLTFIFDTLDTLGLHFSPMSGSALSILLHPLLPIFLKLTIFYDFFRALFFFLRFPSRSPFAS